MDLKQPIRNDEALKLANELNEKYELDKLFEFIKDNKIEFDYKGNIYRVQILNLKDKDELNTLRIKKMNSMMQEKDEKGNYVYLFEKDLIKLYKQREINIDEIEEKIKTLSAEQASIQFKLGDALSKKEGDSILNKFKEDIQKLDGEINALIIQKSTLLEYSLENQLQNYVAQIISYLSLEKKEGENYKRAFETIEDFLKADEELIAQAAKFSILLQYRNV